MKFVLAPDSFKGTMTSNEASDIMAEAILELYPESEIIRLPIADGGEGTLSCYINYFGYRKEKCNIINHLDKEIEASYGIKDDDIIIEVAEACGITQMDYLDPLNSSTYGLGLLIKHAILKHRPKSMTISLGGSATNDLGIGMLRALGVKFYDEEDMEFIPKPLTIKNIKRIDSRACNRLIKGIRIKAICDVTNPLCGEFGATHRFGPQKGLKALQILEIDHGFKCFQSLVKASYHKDVANIHGAGAAGGLGYALVVFLHAHLERGIDTILEMANFDSLIADCDLVMTGEGRFDSSSINGKAISGIARGCKAKGVPLIVFCGIKSKIFKSLDRLGITMVKCINNDSLNRKACKENAKRNLYQAVIEVLKKNK